MAERVTADKRKSRLAHCTTCGLTLISVDGGDWQHIVVTECEPDDLLSS